jgi:hypothetical protein
LEVIVCAVLQTSNLRNTALGKATKAV